METLWQDIRYGFRMLGKNPGFTAVAVLTLALGIGANAAIFHLIDAVLLRSLPIKDPQSLMFVQIEGGNRGFGVSHGNEKTVTFPLWEQIRLHQQSFSAVSAWAGRTLNVGQGTEQKQVRGLLVSGEFFSLLGVSPARGRLIVPEDDRPGCGAPVAVISYGFWQSEFGGQDSALGRPIIIDGHSVDVIGVVPGEFTGLEVGRGFDLAVPLCVVSSDKDLTRRDLFWLSAIGRLKHGVTQAQASAEMKSLTPGAIKATLPDGYSSEALRVYLNCRLGVYAAANGISELRANYSTSLWLLLGTTGMVLLIACANIASLILARAAVRQREMAVRVALGASHWRIVRQLLTESLLLGCSGAAVGALLSGALSRGLVWLISVEEDPLQLDLGTDMRVFLYFVGVAVVTSIAFGLAPAFRMRHTAPVDAMKTNGRGNSGGRERYTFQQLLVVAQVSVSLVLLVGAMLFVRSFWNLLKVDPGFRREGVLIAFVDLNKLELPRERYEPAERELLEQVRSLPQVQSAATTTHLPFNGSWTSGVDVEGTQGSSKFSWVSPGYLQTLRVHLVAGRDFNDRDTSTSPRVAIVSESFVRNFLGGKDPIGRVIRTAQEPNYPAAEYQIVGVATDTRYSDLREESPPPECYAPASQFPNMGPDMALLIQSAAPLAEVSAAVRQKIGQANPDASIEFLVLEKYIDDQLLRERAMAMLSGAFGLLAGLLAVIGLYGVISYIVALRRSEIGIRMALGATRQNIVKIVLRQTTLMLTLGIVLGAILALGVTAAASTLLYGVRPTDPLSLSLASGLLASVALVAGYVPARRATKVDPMVALRYE
jgi:predicted permease